MLDKRKFNIISLIFVVAIGLRVILAILNRDANDNHIDVVNWIVDKQDIPQKTDCWSCYQPKLFYVVSAIIIKVFKINYVNDRIVTTQILNVFFGFLILMFFWKFIKKQNVNKNTKILTFAFFAFNPCLTGINIQGTNDTLEIFLGVAVIYFADAFFSEFKKQHFIYLVLSLIAAALTKASGLILFAISFLFFIIKIMNLGFQNKKNLMIYFLILLISFCSIVPFAGGYYNNYKKFNSLTLSTWNKDSPPLFYTATYVSRPGLIDLFHGWFTFRIFDMIKTPYINNGSADFPIHRTSLWSQLYGRSVFLHFDQWPENWQSHKQLIINIGRFLITFGIIPLILILIGFYLTIYEFIKGIFLNGKSYLANSNNILHAIVTILFLLSSLKYSYDYRDFSAMKSIYIFPGFLSYIYLFLAGIGTINSKTIFQIVFFIIILIIGLSIFDIIYLIFQLYQLDY